MIINKSYQTLLLFYTLYERIFLNFKLHVSFYSACYSRPTTNQADLPDAHS